MGKLSGFVTGAVVGAAAALLLTPKRGDEWRDELSEKLKTQGNDLLNNAKAKGAEVKTTVAQKAEQVAGQVVDQVKDKADLVKEKAGQLKDEATLQAHLASMEVQEKSEAVNEPETTENPEQV